MADLFESTPARAPASDAKKPGSRPVSLHSDTEIYRAVIELAKCVILAMADMRRDMKPTLGRYLLDEVVWMTVLILRANKARGADKLPHLDELLEQVEIVTVAIRLARETAFFPHSKYEIAAPLIVSVARQAAALRNTFAPAS